MFIIVDELTGCAYRNSGKWFTMPLRGKLSNEFHFTKEEVDALSFNFPVKVYPI